MRRFLTAAFLCFALFAEAQIAFVENKGQWPAQVKYKAEVPGGRMWIQEDGFAYEMVDTVLFMKDHHRVELPESVKSYFFLQRLANAHLTQALCADAETGYYNFYLGADSAQWATGVKRFKNILFPNVYSNIDLRLIGKSRSVKYQFELAPHANPNLIAWHYHDSLSVSLKENGSLVSSYPIGSIFEEAPVAFQLINGKVITVNCHYVLDGHTVRFALGDYNPNYPLTIDPNISFSTYIGSTANNFGFTACDDLNGNLVSGASVFGNNYPVTANAFSTVFNPTSGNYFDVAISKFNATGDALLYSTYLGGKHQETPHSVIVDHADNILVFGVTGSNDFPTTASSYQPTFVGGPPLMMSSFFTSGHPDGTDFFITKFNASGNLMSSTFLGDNTNEGLNYAYELFYNYGDAFRGEINVDVNDNVFIASCVRGNTLIAGNAIQSSYGGGDSDGYIAKFSPNLNNLLMATYIGGNGADALYSLEFANDGSILVGGGTQSSNLGYCALGADPSFNGGTDGFILKINPGTFAVVSGTFVGTSDYDQVYFVQTDLSDNIYCLGQTAGNMPITTGLYGQANSGQFIKKFSPSLNTQTWSTTIGTGSGEIDISPTAFLVSDCNQIYFSGWGGHTNSGTCPFLTCLAYNSTTTGMPVTADAFQATTDGSDFYLAVLDADATQLAYGSFLGGALSAEHVDGGTSRFDKSGSVYQAVCAGCQNNDDFPTTQGAWSSTNNSSGCNLAVFRFDLAQLTAIASIQGPSTICVGTTAQFLNATQGASDFLWDFGDGSATSVASQPTHSFNQVGTYTVSMIASANTGCYYPDTAYVTVTVIDFTPPSVSPVNPICLGTTVQLQAVGSSNAFWLPTTSLNPINSLNPIASPQVTTTYGLVDFNQCQSDTAFVTVTVIIPNANAGPDQTICLGGSANLLASGGGTYAWQATASLSSLNTAQTVATPTQDETFYVTITTPQGCTDTDSVTVFVLASAPGGNTYEPITICLGESATLVAEQADQYLWSPAATLNTTQSQTVIATPTVNTVYTVTLLNICGSGTSTVLVNVIELQVNASDGGTVCKNVLYPISASGAASYQWLPASSVVSTFSPTTFAIPPSSSWIFVIGTDLYGCTDTDSLYMNILPLPTVDAGPNVTYAYPETAQLQGSTGGLPYTWSPVTGLSCTDCLNPFVFAADVSWYVLSATDANGCVGVDSVLVTPYFPVYVPNCITPDGDGLNDFFFVVGERIDAYHLQIFDRWGILIFESFNQAEPWNGGINGYYVQNDVYTWKLYYKSLKGNEELSGHVTVVR